MSSSPESPSDHAELLLRTSRRALVVLLAIVLLVAATLVAHALRPGTLLADWSSKVPWLFPMAVVGVLLLLNRGKRPLRPDDPAVRMLLGDEFRQANLGRAQRLALIVVLVAQVPFGLLLSSLTAAAAAAAVMVMAILTITLGMVTLITSFLFFDRE
jgi:hypothetical protein